MKEKKVLNILRVIFIVLTVITVIGLCVGLGGLGICCAWEISYWYRIWMTVITISVVSLPVSVGMVVFLFND